MKKKYILTLTIIMQVVALLFVVSYAWFLGDYNNRNIINDEINISTTEDLILSYKNETYTSLNLNSVLSPKFTFEQVSSTGLDGDLFYKIDYTPKLNNMPAQYVEATVNEDYIELDLTLSSVSKAKRVYLDGINSGFFVGEEDGDPLATDMTAANAMRCSISYTDQYGNKRSIVFANEWYKSSVTYSQENPSQIIDDTRIILLEDTYDKDENTGNQYYVDGVPQYVNYAENLVVNNPGGGELVYNAITASGIENAIPFTCYDFNNSNENLILFDLNPYTVKDIKLKIWLDGTACKTTPIGEGDNQSYRDLISGRPIKFNLRFASSMNLGVECSTKIVEEGMQIDTINTYSTISNNITASKENNPFFVSYTDDYYQLKTEYYTVSGNTLNYRYTGSGAVINRTYQKVTIGGVDYFKDTRNEGTESNPVDPLYYDLAEKKAYVKYGDLNWGISYPGYNAADTLPNYATINGSTHKVVVGHGYKGDFFTLIGYVYANGKKLVVVNENYTFGDAIEVNKYDPIAITSNKIYDGVYNDGLIGMYNNTEDFFTVIINGVSTTFDYDDHSHFIWVVKNIPGVTPGNEATQNIINNCTYDSTNHWWKVDEDTVDNVLIYKDISVNYNDINDNTTFNLIGLYKSGNTYREVISILYFVNK